jgi:suppressor of ftsI
MRLLPLLPTLAALLATGFAAGPPEPFCGLETPPPGAPAPDLHCVELLPRFEVRGASGWGTLRPAPSPFGVALDRDGIVRWNLAIEVQGLPDPATLDPAARAWVAWVTGPNLVPEIALGEVAEGVTLEGAVALDKFRILVTAEADPATATRTGPVALRGESPSMRLLPHDEPWLFEASTPVAGHEAHAPETHAPDPPGEPAGTPAPLAWRMPPMHPAVPMPPGLAHLVPPVTPWLPAMDLDAAARAALPEVRPTRTVRLADGDAFTLVPGPVRRTVRGREHVAFGYNGQVPGPLLLAPTGATIQVAAGNALPFATAMHWHGVRLDNRFDGVPGVTQDPIAPGEVFQYRVHLRDAGLFWYHPHLRDDATQGLGLYGNLRVFPEDAWRESAGARTSETGATARGPLAGGGAPAPAGTTPPPEGTPPPPPGTHREVPWILDDLLVQDDGTLYPFGLEAPTHALMGRFGNVTLVNGQERPELVVDRGEVVRFHLTNAATARPFHVVFSAPDPSIPAPRVKLVGTDLSPFQRQAWVEGVILGPAERYVVDVRFDAPGVVQVENRVRATDPFYGSIFPHLDTLATVRVRDTPPRGLPAGAPPFEALATHARVHAEVEALRSHLSRPPDRELVLAMETEELPFPLGPMMQLDSAHFQPVEWISTMPEMNAPLTPAEVRWILRDPRTGLENGAIDWRFREGDLVRLRVTNERRVLHAMQHPVHVHGQRFLVLALNGVVQENLAWKDTFLLPTGWTAELLVDMSNPGDWMLHCHIAEHLAAGMQTVFRVEPAEGPPWEGWRGYEPGRGGGHH